MLPEALCIQGAVLAGAPVLHHDQLRLVPQLAVLDSASLPHDWVDRLSG